MEFKGTKGEWSVEQELGYDCDVIYEGGEICWLGLSDVIDEEKIANAQLIAAAPGLLKALQDLLNQDRIKLSIEASGHLSEFNDKVKACEKAINKALGL
jgi:hypothetical protein